MMVASANSASKMTRAEKSASLVSWSAAPLSASCASTANARSAKKESARSASEPLVAETSPRPPHIQLSKTHVPRVTARFASREHLSMLPATSESKKPARSALKETARSALAKNASLVRRSLMALLFASRKTQLSTVILNLTHVKEATVWFAARRVSPPSARSARTEAAESASKVNAPLVLPLESALTATTKDSVLPSQSHFQHFLQLFAAKASLA